MKEFIDKLIEELEGVKSIVNSPADIVWNNAVKMCIYKANELAEEYKGGWVSVNERLPKQNEEVLATILLKGKPMVLIINYDHKWLDDGLSKLIAWMPLPPAWEGETELYRAKSVDGEYQEYKGDWK